MCLELKGNPRPCIVSLVSLYNEFEERKIKSNAASFIRTNIRDSCTNMNGWTGIGNFTLCYVLRSKISLFGHFCPPSNKTHK